MTNEKLKRLIKLHSKKHRDQTGTFLIEGEHLIQEAKDNGIIIIEVFSSKDHDGTQIEAKTMARLSQVKTPQGIVALCRKPDTKGLGNKVLVLDDLQDPGNVGTLIRTAKAFGFEDIVISGVDIFNDKVVRSSQGAILSTNIIQTDDVSKFFEGYEVIGAVLDKTAVPYKDFKPSEKFMLVLGNEGNGIPHDHIDRLDKKVYIPIKFESLNVSQAGAILLAEYN